MPDNNPAKPFPLVEYFLLSRIFLSGGIGSAIYLIVTFHDRSIFDTQFRDTKDMIDKLMVFPIGSSLLLCGLLAKALHSYTLSALNGKGASSDNSSLQAANLISNISIPFYFYCLVSCAFNLQNTMAQKNSAIVGTVFLSARLFYEVQTFVDSLKSYCTQRCGEKSKYPNNAEPESLPPSIEDGEVNRLGRRG